MIIASAMTTIAQAMRTKWTKSGQTGPTTKRYIANEYEDEAEDDDNEAIRCIEQC